MLTRDEIYSGLTQIFRELFDDESIALTDKTTAADVEGWDSFNNLNMIAAAEQAFGVKIGTREIESLTCVGDLVNLIEKKSK
ncbi:acyl carrier protein [Rhodoblastus sp.]|uniref:acyl carrier protein n=1 Tax=Rhodoblastus sp. TaxID=1962975 RepID=UPI003F974EFD